MNFCVAAESLLKGLKPDHCTIQPSRVCVHLSPLCLSTFCISVFYSLPVEGPEAREHRDAARHHPHARHAHLRLRVRGTYCAWATGTTWIWNPNTWMPEMCTVHEQTEPRGYVCLLHINREFSQCLRVRQKLRLKFTYMFYVLDATSWVFTRALCTWEPVVTGSALHSFQYHFEHSKKICW